MISWFLLWYHIWYHTWYCPNVYDIMYLFNIILCVYGIIQDILCDIIIVILYHRFCMISYYSYIKVCNTFATWEDSAWYHIWYHVWYQSYKMISYNHAVTCTISYISYMILQFDMISCTISYISLWIPILTACAALPLQRPIFPGTALQCKVPELYFSPK